MLQQHITLRAGDTQVVLRPTLGALGAIEQATGRPVKQLLAEGMKADTLRQVAEIAGAGKAHITDEELLSQKAAITSFLAGALGGGGASPDFREMFMIYVGVMGRPVAEFWNITLAEYALVLEGFCLHHNIDLAAAGMPATSHDLAEMQERFPDDGRRTDNHKTAGPKA